MPRPNRSDVCACATPTPAPVSMAAVMTRRAFRIVFLRDCSEDVRLESLRPLASGVHARICRLRMRSILVACAVAGILGLGAVADAVAQDTTIRLEGDGRLGRAADEFRGTSAAYGYEGTPPSVIPAVIELAR